MHKLVLENIPCPIWIQHIDSTIIFLNKAYEKMFHVKAENIIGKTNREAFNEETAKIYNQQMNSCLESASVYIAEGIIDGVFVESYIFPLLDYKGEAQGVAGVIIDVHDRKDREIELENQKNILRIIIDAVPEAIFYKDK
ncbi:MAG: PAS domain-containing protein, partial [Cellulosilyticaceae bacterium]